jgi:hypothetical protein
VIRWTDLPTWVRLFTIVVGGPALILFVYMVVAGYFAGYLLVVSAFLLAVVFGVHTIYAVRAFWQADH